jgi:hypothetical protein
VASYPRDTLVQVINSMVRVTEIGVRNRRSVVTLAAVLLVSTRVELVYGPADIPRAV